MIHFFLDLVKMVEELVMDFFVDLLLVVVEMIVMVLIVV